MALFPHMVILIALLGACGEASLVDGSSGARLPFPGSVSQQSGDAGTEVSEPPEPLADDPVPVAGAFFAQLDCAYRTAIVVDARKDEFSCRLMDAGGSKVTLPASDFAIEFKVYNGLGQLAGATLQRDLDPANPWHWSSSLDEIDAIGAKVQGTITYQGVEYVTNMAPIRELQPTFTLFGAKRIYALGEDGTFNCDPNQRESGEVVDITSPDAPFVFLAVDFTVPKGGSKVKIDLINICEVDNAGVKAFVRQTNLAKPTRVTPDVTLPINTSSSSWTPTVSVLKDKDLKEGTYQLVIQTFMRSDSLEDVYIDDIVMTGTRELRFQQSDMRGLADIPGIANDTPYGNIIIVSSSGTITVP